MNLMMNGSPSSMFLQAYLLFTPILAGGCNEPAAPEVKVTQTSQQRVESSVSPILPAPDFEMPVWGESLSKIKVRYPNGQSFGVSKEETHYRVEVRALGRPALATFCIRQKAELQVFVLEFVGEANQIDLQTGDYTRPTAGEALTLHGALVKWITERYGEPTYTNGEESTGCLRVFGRQHNEFIRLDLIPIGQARANLVMWLEDRSVDVSQSHSDKALIAGLWKTPPSSWSKTAMFDVNWGMGPGDVRQRYRDLTSILISPDEPTHTYQTDGFVEGNVGMDFRFFEGRLVELRISPYRYSGRSRGSLGKSELEELWREWDFWRESVLKVLEEKYGKPLPGYANFAFEKDKKPKGPPNVWSWRTESTLIDLSKVGAMSSLAYREIGTLSSVENAEKAHEDRKTREEKKKF